MSKITPDDLISEKYGFATEKEFKFLVSHYLDAVRKKEKIKSEVLARRMNKSESAFSVMKHYGISTFEAFFEYCEALGLNPVKVIKRCLELQSHFQNDKNAE